MSDTLLDAAGETALYDSFRHYWLPVAYSRDLDGEPVAVRVCGNDLVLVRLGGRARAFADLCPHRGARLSLGWVETDSLRCSYHGWLYDCGGVCTQIPGSEDHPIPARARLRGYGCEEAGGLVWVCLEDRPRFDVPEIPRVRRPRVPDCSDPRRRLERGLGATDRELRRLGPHPVGARRPARTPPTGLIFRGTTFGATATTSTCGAPSRRFPASRPAPRNSMRPTPRSGRTTTGASTCP